MSQLKNDMWGSERGHSEHIMTVALTPLMKFHPTSEVKGLKQKNKRKSNELGHREYKTSEVLLATRDRILCSGIKALSTGREARDDTTEEATPVIPTLSL